MNNITPVENPLAGMESSQLAAEVTDMVKANLPREKAMAEAQMNQTAKEVKAGLAPSSGDGRGQPVASIPPIVYLRWEQEFPGFWKDRSSVEDFLFDNPRCCLPGFKPRSKRVFFDMKHSNMKLCRPGGDFYQANKIRVNASIAAMEANVARG